MSSTNYGGETKPQLKLEGKKVIVENIGVYSYEEKFDKAFTYTREVIYHFENEDKAKEYFYKKR